MPRIPFGQNWQNVDPVQRLDGIANGLKNGYREVLGEGVEHFTKWPGFTDSATSLAGTYQDCIETTDGVVYFVAGGVVYELSEDGTTQAFTGTSLNSNVQCKFAEDGTNVFIAHGGYIAKADRTARVVSLLTSGPNNATHVVYQDGYLLANGLISGGVAGDVNFSDDVANNYASWEVFNNEESPDACNALVQGWQEIYAFGTETVSPSYNDGSTPWASIQGGLMEYGTLAPYSPLLVDNTLFWLGSADGAVRVMKMVGRSPQVISTAYDRVLNQSGFTVADAEAWTQTVNGYVFYVLSFPTEDLTIAYNIQTQEWSELAYWDNETAQYEHYRGKFARYIKSWGKTIMGDRLNFSVVLVGGLSESGDDIRMELTSGRIEWGTSRKKRRRRLLFEVKTGQTTGFGEPSFSYRIRNDNQGWSNFKTVTLKKVGNTNPYIKKHHQGIYRSEQIQIVHTDQTTDFILLNVEEENELLSV